MIQLAARSSAWASQGSARAAIDLGGQRGGDAVEVRRRPGGLDGAVLVDERVAEAPGDGGVGRVGDLLDDADEQPRLLARSGRRGRCRARASGATG